LKRSCPEDHIFRCDIEISFQFSASSSGAISPDQSVLPLPEVSRIICHLRVGACSGGCQKASCHENSGLHVHCSAGLLMLSKAAIDLSIAAIYGTSGVCVNLGTVRMHK